MNDRCYFIADEIACCYVDDFLNLPAERFQGNVYVGLLPATQRHANMFFLTH